MSGNDQACASRGAALLGVLAAVLAIALMERATFYGIRVSTQAWFWDEDLGAAQRRLRTFAEVAPTWLMVGTLFAGVAGLRVRPAWIVVVGSALACGGLLVMALATSEGSGPPTAAFLMGLGAMAPGIFALVCAAVPRAHARTASFMVLFLAINVGGAAGPILNGQAGATSTLLFACVALLAACTLAAAYASWRTVGLAPRLTSARAGRQALVLGAVLAARLAEHCSASVDTALLMQMAFDGLERPTIAGGALLVVAIWLGGVVGFVILDRRRDSTSALLLAAIVLLVSVGLGSSASVMEEVGALYVVVGALGLGVSSWLVPLLLTALFDEVSPAASVAAVWLAFTRVFPRWVDELPLWEDPASVWIGPLLALAVAFLLVALARTRQPDAATS